jgi:hypothetical protein
MTPERPAGSPLKLGLMHDCSACRAGVERATAFLRDNPDGEVAVGQLWWPPNRASRRNEGKLS